MGWVQAVNTRLVETYWQVGRHIVKFEQAGPGRAEYGKALIDTLAADLGLRHGKGFSRSNLIRLRRAPAPFHLQNTARGAVDTPFECRIE